MTAQIVQPDRFEIPLNKSEALFDVIPAREDGLFLYRSLLYNNLELLELVKLDTSFTKQWQGFLALDPKFHLMGKRTHQDKLFLLLRHQEITRKDLQLYIIQQQDGKYEKFLIRNFIPFVPSDFQVTTNGAIIGGYYNNIPVVIFYSFKKHTSKILPGLLNEAGELTQIKINPDGAFDVLISAYDFKGHRTIWIKHYNAEGDLQYHSPIKTEGNKHLIFGRSVSTNGEMQLIAGTYGNRKSEYSKGIFISSIHPNGLQQVKYYNYGDLQNFFQYMKVKREKRIKDRIERRKIKGKKIRFNYRFIVHEIVPYNDQFVLLGEAFYPKYQSVDSRFGNSFFYTSGFPNSMVHNGRIFDGFRYTHAVVMGFDKNGRLLWDNSFEINDVKTFTLEQFVKMEIQDRKMVLLYLFDNQIRSKIIEGNEVVEGKTKKQIRTFFPDEIAKNEKSGTGKSRMDYWYSDYFYAYGVQQIVNAQNGERRVFFINKISYSDQQGEN